jgi:hypothetical protein
MSHSDDTPLAVLRREQARLDDRFRQWGPNPDRPTFLWPYEHVGAGSRSLLVFSGGDRG